MSNGLREKLKVADDNIRIFSQAEFNCDLDANKHIGILKIGDFEMKVFAGDLVANLVSVKDGKTVIKHKITLYEI